MSVMEETSKAAVVNRPARQAETLKPHGSGRPAGRALWAVAVVGAAMLLLQAALIPLHLTGAGAVVTTGSATSAPIMSASAAATA